MFGANRSQSPAPGRGGWFTFALQHSKYIVAAGFLIWLLIMLSMPAVYPLPASSSKPHRPLSPPVHRQSLERGVGHDGDSGGAGGGTSIGIDLPGGGGAGANVGVGVVAVVPQTVTPQSREAKAFFAAVKGWAEDNLDLHVVLVLPSNVKVHKGFKKAADRVRGKVVQPCSGGAPRHTCSRLVAYTDLANYGAQLLPANTQHVFFLSLALLSHRSLLPDLLPLIKDDPTVGVVGCTITLRPNLSSAADPAKVVEHGLTLGNGWVGPVWKPHLLRNYHGFTAVDARLANASEVLAVSPFCMLISGRVWNQLGGMRKLASSVQEQIELGQVPPDFVSSQSDYLKKKLVVLGANLAQAGAGHRESFKQKLVRKEAAAVSEEALSLLEYIEGAPFNPLQEISVPATDIAGPGTFYESLGNMAKEMETLVQKIQTLEFTGVAGTHEEGGWDMCLRVRKRGLKVLAAPTQIEFSLRDIPTVMRPLAKSTEGDQLGGLAPPSLVVNGAFGTVWSDYIRKDFWPGHALYHNATTNAVFRIIWQSFCCHCCGFANEILHLVFPLQRKHAIDLIPAPDCFCQGYPTGVLDSLARMHLPQQKLGESKSEDEIIIWVSHTDPGSYLSNPLANKRPNYVVGRSMYEFTKIPGRWVNESRDNADEVWVPSQFVRDVWIANGVPPEKVVLIPEAVDVYFYDPSVAGRMTIPFEKRYRHYDSRNKTVAEMDQSYKFLSHFKWEDRKGWDILFEAYFGSFTPEDNVVLIVLTHIWFPGPPETHGDPGNYTMIRETVVDLARTRLGKSEHELPHYILLTSRFSEEDVAALYNSVDGFVLPTKGEGWGLPPLQAMSMGVPTCTTNWSGTVDFLSPDHSFPIPIAAVEEIPKDSYYGWSPGKSWGVPSLNATKTFMKYMADPANKQELLALGVRARKYVVQHFSEEAVASIVSQRIEEIKKLILSGNIPHREPHWY